MAVRLAAVFRFHRPLAVSSGVSIRHASGLPEQKQPVPFPGVMSLLKEKTGETGKIALGVGLGAALLSKEILVIHAETIVAGAIFGTVWYLVKKLGKPTADFLDNRSQGILNSLSMERNSIISDLEENIKTEDNVENVLSIRNEIFDIIKEQSDLLREEEYRRRLADVKSEVQKRLEYQLQLESLHSKYEQRHLISWLEDAVRQTLQSKPDESIPKCISTLKSMSAAATS